MTAPDIEGKVAELLKDVYLCISSGLNPGPSTLGRWHDMLELVQDALSTPAAAGDWYERWQEECTRDHGPYPEDGPLPNRLRWWRPKSARHGSLTLEDDLCDAADALAEGVKVREPLTNAETNEALMTATFGAAPSVQSQAPEPLVHIEPSGYISDWGQAARQEAVAAEPPPDDRCYCLLDRICRPCREKLAKRAPPAAAPGEVELPPLPEQGMTKAAYVKAQDQTREHHCHWPGCPRQVPPAMWGCKEHWFTLPMGIRAAIWRTYRPGQEQDGTPDAAYLTAAKEAQAWIAARAAGRT